MQAAGRTREGRFWLHLILFWIVAALWGVGCSDFAEILHFEGHGSAFGPWGLLPGVIGIGLVARSLHKHGKDRQEPRELLFIFGGLLAAVGGWTARDRAAAEFWDLQCARRVRPTYCYKAASLLGTFRVDGRDLLGRSCMPGEPPLLCTYDPPDDRESCARMARACASARNARWRRHAFVEPVCGVFTQTCARAAAGPSRPKRRYPGPPPWPPGWPHPVLDQGPLPAWLTAKRDAGPRDGAGDSSR
jgi:hypothetical protein